MKSLAVIITHPIQYYVPIFKELNKYCNLKVFYTWGEQGAKEKYDPGFKKNIAWDVPLLEGYDYEFLINIAKDAGSHHFNGIVNPFLIKKINEFAPDVILVYGWAFKSHLSALRYFKGKVPIWFRGDSTLLDEQKGIKQILRSVFLKWVYKHVDKVLYVGSENKKYFQKFGVKERDLIFVPHAIDNLRFKEDRALEANKLRTVLKVDDNDILILFAGKLEEKKNPLLLLNTFLELKDKNLHLLFVGNGMLKEKLKATLQNFITNEGPLADNITTKDLNSNLNTENSNNNLAAQNQKPNRVHFIDFQNQTQMPVVYQACDLFCLPSQGPGETWGLAVNEAMAAGKAVLVADKVGCAPDLINNQTGLIFKSNNVDDLKQKLIALTHNKEKLALMGKSAQQHIQFWSFEKQVNAILNYVNR